MARLHGKFSEIRIPPQSTGPRIQNTIYQNLTLTSIGGTLAVGMEIEGQTSGAIGEIVDLNTVSTTDIVVLFDNASPVQSFTDGETVDIDGAAFTASSNSPVDMYVNMTQVVDSFNPHRGQRVDVEGSAHVRYSEGEQQLDAFGITKVTSSQLLGAFTFQYSASPSGLSKISAGSASDTHLPNEASLRLDVTTAATDSYKVISDQYFPYTPGIGREAIYTLACGDSGKTDVIRRWGQYDDDNGVFFELNETTFNVVVRSNTTGTPVDTRVAQANFNRDVVDGSGEQNNRSGVNLDVTKYNIYWVDYQWLGAGRVRFGIYKPDGERVILHAVENANQNTSVYMSTGSLPARAEIFNTGITSGASSLKLTCGSILDSKTPQVSAVPPTNSYTRTNISVTTTETVLLNLRSSTSLGTIDPQRLVSTGLKGTVLTETSPVIVRIYENPTIGGSPSWSNASAYSPLQVDTAGTQSSGKPVASFLVGTDEGSSEDLTFLVCHLLANGTDSKIYSVTAQSLNATTDVALAFVWYDRG